MIRDILGYSGSPGADLFCQLLHAVCNFWIFGARPRPTVWAFFQDMICKGAQGIAISMENMWAIGLIRGITRFPGEVVPFAPLLTSFEKCQIWHRIRTAKITALDLAMSRIFAECLCYTLYQTPHLCVISCNSYIIFGKNLDLPCPVQDLRTLNMVGVLLLSCKMLTEVGSNTFKQDLKRTLTCTNPFSLLFAHGCCK